MKQVLALMLVLVLVLCLFGCGAGETAPAQTAPETTVPEETTVPPTEAETEPPVTEPVFALSTWQGNYDQGLYFMEGERWQEAYAAFDAAVALDPQQPDGYAQRGNALILLEENEENLSLAWEDYQHALTLDEANALAYLGIVDVHIRRCEVDEAIAAMEDALAKNDNDPVLTERSEQLDNGRFVDSANKNRYARRMFYNGEGAYCGYVLTEVADGKTSCVKSFDAKGNLTGCVEVSKATTDNVTVYNGYHINVSNNERYVVVARTIETTTRNADGTYELETVSFNSDGERTSSNLAYHDVDGRVVRQENFDADGNLRSVDTKEYDESGNEIRIVRYFPDGSLDQSIVYEYDDNGNRIRSDFFNENDELTSYSLYYYDDQGKSLGMESYQPDGGLMYSNITK